MLNLTEIDRIWRSSKHLKHVLFKPFLNLYCFVAGHIILLKEATAIREYCFL